ncbi:MAG TPA: P-loop NTPase [Longimicrobiales bacterium]|nr:P-loop NTPase [Longimicrobiales bacterium]
MRRFRTYHEVEDTARDIPAQVAAQQERLTRRLADVRAVWLVGSGKGGVGKSAVTANLAAALADRSFAVGGLDADVNGPSLARMLGAERGPLRSDPDGVTPAAGVAGTRVIGMDLLLGSPDAPVRWREPDAAAGFVWQGSLEAGAVREFLSDVAWGSLDVLLIDLPPGTDKLSRALQLVPDPAGVLLVTTPSEAARAVVARSARLLRDAAITRAGLVVNMAGHACPACGHVDPLFADAADDRLVRESGLETWARIPFHSGFATATDAGRPPVRHDPDSPAAAALLGLADRIIRTLNTEVP